jgi:hypothetical protein
MLINFTFSSYVIGPTSDLVSPLSGIIYSLEPENTARDKTPIAINIPVRR